MSSFANAARPAFATIANSTMKLHAKAHDPAPNWAVKPTPTLAMPSAFSWPVLVPSALTGSGAAYLGR